MWVRPFDIKGLKTTPSEHAEPNRLVTPTQNLSTRPTQRCWMKLFSLHHSWLLSAYFPSLPFHRCCSRLFHNEHSAHWILWVCFPENPTCNSGLFHYKVTCSAKSRMKNNKVYGKNRGKLSKNNEVVYGTHNNTKNCNKNVNQLNLQPQSVDPYNLKPQLRLPPSECDSWQHLLLVEASLIKIKMEG